MRLRRRVRHASIIPTASMADIAMLLLIFFLSTAIIRSQAAFEVRLPGSTTGERLHREEAVRVWLGPNGETAVNDARVPLEEIAPILAAKIRRNPRLVVALHADARAPYADVARVFDSLKRAQAPRVALAAGRGTAP